MTVIVLALGLSLAAAPTEADKLFNKGRELMKTKPAEACSAFEKSFELDPALGTLMNLGVCFETIDRHASAWLSFNRAREWATRTHEVDRETLARTRAEALAPKLSWLAISTTRPAPGLEVEVDGQKLAINGALSQPVDPGTHTLSASAVGYAPWKTTVTAPVSGNSLPVVVPELVSLTPSASPVRAVEPAPPAPPLVVHEQARHSKTPGVIAITAGATLTVAGAVAMAWCLNVNSNAQSQRINQSSTQAARVSLSEFKTAGALYPASLAATGVGLAATGLGIWLLVRTPVSNTVSVAPIPGGSVLVFAGSF